MVKKCLSRMSGKLSRTVLRRGEGSNPSSLVDYTSKAFQRLLYMNKVVQSFSNSGKPRDNAVAESFFASLKTEELYRTNYKSEREFRENVENYMIFYYAERPHKTLAYKTPDRFEQTYGKMNNPV